MKVFLGNSPWAKKGYYGIRAGSRWPHFEEEHHEYMPFPFFLAYAAAVLEEYDFDVLLVDGIAEGISESEFVSKITSFGPDLILLEVSTISIEVDLALLRKLRKSAGKDTKIAVCGLHAYMYEPSFLKENHTVDFIQIDFFFEIPTLLTAAPIESRQVVKSLLLPGPVRHTVTEKNQGTTPAPYALQPHHSAAIVLGWAGLDVCLRITIATQSDKLPRVRFADANSPVRQHSHAVGTPDLPRAIALTRDRFEKTPVGPKN